MRKTDKNIQLFATIPGFLGRYLISRRGEIYDTHKSRYVATNPVRRTVSGYICLGVGLSLDGQRVSRSVPRLIYKAFRDTDISDYCVVVADGNHAHPKLQNLVLKERSQPPYVSKWVVMDYALDRKHYCRTAVEASQYMGLTDSAVAYRIKTFHKGMIPIFDGKTVIPAEYESMLPRLRNKDIQTSFGFHGLKIPIEARVQ